MNVSLMIIYSAVIFNSKLDDWGKIKDFKTRLNFAYVGIKIFSLIRTPIFLDTLLDSSSKWLVNFRCSGTPNTFT